MIKKDYETLAAFRYELRKYLRFSEEAAIEHGLTPQQYQALLAIEGFPNRSEVTVGELAEQLQIAAHSAVGLVDRLQSSGLIRRHRSVEDRRCVYVALTAQGKAALRKLASVHHNALQTVGPLLAGLLARVSPATPPANPPKASQRTARKTMGRASASLERRPNASPVCYAEEVE